MLLKTGEMGERRQRNCRRWRGLRSTVAIPNTGVTGLSCTLQLPSSQLEFDVTTVRSSLWRGVFNLLECHKTTVVQGVGPIITTGLERHDRHDSPLSSPFALR